MDEKITEISQLCTRCRWPALHGQFCTYCVHCWPSTQPLLWSCNVE